MEGFFSLCPHTHFFFFLENIPPITRRLVALEKVTEQAYTCSWRGYFLRFPLPPPIFSPSDRILYTPQQRAAGLPTAYWSPLPAVGEAVPTRPTAVEIKADPWDVERWRGWAHSASRRSYLRGKKCLMLGGSREGRSLGMPAENWQHVL